jgi:hypothetical protein
MRKLVVSLCLAAPLLAQAQTYITPEGAGGAIMTEQSRTAIIRQFGEDPDVRSQREAYEAQLKQREADRQRQYREQDQQLQQRLDERKSAFYCAAPEHQNEAGCR